MSSTMRKFTQSDFEGNRRKTTASAGIGLARYSRAASQPAAYTDDNAKTAILIAQLTSAVSGSRIAINGFTSTPAGQSTPSSYARLIDVDYVTATEGTRTSARSARPFQPAKAMAESSACRRRP